MNTQTIRVMIIDDSYSIGSEMGANDIINNFEDAKVYHRDVPLELAEHFKRTILHGVLFDTGWTTSGIYISYDFGTGWEPVQHWS